MENYQNSFNVSSFQQESSVDVRTFMNNVFTWMGGALAVTALFAYLFSRNLDFVLMMYTETGLSIFGWVIMLLPLAFALTMSWAFNKLSYPLLVAFFAGYAIAMGISLSAILLIYTMQSIFITFAITSGMFITMAIAGYTTKTDLSKMGSILMMALVGIIIASLVNFFMKSEMMGYIISFIGVLVFTGLTAYDVQKLKNMASSSQMVGEFAKKVTIMGALTLYLDFINLFLFLLRLFGKRN